MKKWIIFILALTLTGILPPGYSQEKAILQVSRILVIPNKPESGKCCFTVQVWAKNIGTVASGTYKMWVYVKQLPKPGTDQMEQYMTKDHGSGEPLIKKSIPPNQEVLVYNRSDWVVNFPQLHSVSVEIVGHGIKVQYFEAW